MRIVHLTINRPITTFMVYTAVILMGVVALINLSIDLLPDINFPVLSIKTQIPGYLPEEVETIITKPVEDQVSTMNNVHSVRSTSSEGSCLRSTTVTLPRSAPSWAEAARISSRAPGCQSSIARGTRIW